MSSDKPDGHDSFNAAADRLQELLITKRDAKPQYSEPSTASGCMKLGVRGEYVVLSLDATDIEIILSPDEADQLSADLRQFSLELRNGGRFE